MSLLLLALACGEARDEAAAPASGWTDAELALIQSISGLPELPPSPSNAYADDPAAATLGADLFFDTRLSSNGAVSCASCHAPEHYFSDPKALSEGLGRTGRHAPSIVGAQYGAWFFWDGRADSLWAQSLGPLEHPDEHDTTRLEVAHLIGAHHRDTYEAAFGPLPELSDLKRFPPSGMPDPGFDNGADNQAWTRMASEDQDAINRVFANAGKALEAYERRLLPRENALDRYAADLAAGGPGGAWLTEEQERGLALFIGDAGCINCHNGPLLTDDAFHNLGLPVDARAAVDMGRAVGARRVMVDPFNCEGPYSDAEDCPELRYLNPEFPDFILAFKTPSLRNVARTSPYMHDGAFSTLGDVLNFYQHLPGAPVVGHRELTLAPLQLPDEDLKAIEAFLGALTGEAPPS